MPELDSPSDTDPEDICLAEDYKACRLQDSQAHKLKKRPVKVRVTDNSTHNFSQKITLSKVGVVRDNSDQIDAARSVNSPLGTSNAFSSIPSNSIPSSSIPSSSL